MKRNKEKGITLIALVVTIVVLLILAGISIAMLTGEDGIITRAKQAKEDTRGGEVKELVELAASGNKLVRDGNEEEKTSKQEMIEELQSKRKLTDEEVEELADKDTITIGNITIDFSKLNGTENESNMITFTIKGEYIYDEDGNFIYGDDGWAISQDTTYTVPNGMTWGEFINSEYNTVGYQTRRKFKGEWEDTENIYEKDGTEYIVPYMPEDLSDEYVSGEGKYEYVTIDTPIYDIEYRLSPEE